MPTNQPPVEAIQGEARAREVLGKEAGYNGPIPLEIYGIALAVTTITAIRAMLAFQSEGRAVPSGGELRDMPADDEIRLLREALTIYGDRVRMARSARPDLQQVIDYAFEHTPYRPAFGGDSETRHLPHQADREAIARIIDPRAWGRRQQFLDSISDANWRKGHPAESIAKSMRISGQTLADEAVASSLAKADAILALSPTPSATLPPATEKAER